MANPNEIAVLQAVLTQAQKVIDFDRFYAALYDRVTVQLEFPIVAQRRNGKMEVLSNDAVSWHPRPYDPEAQFPDNLFPAGQPVFVERNLQTWLKEREGSRLVCVPEPDPWPLSWLGVPLKARGRTIGFIVIEHHNRKNAYDVRLQRLFQTMVNRAGGTLATTRLVESLRLVNRVGQTLTAGAHLTVEKILVLIHEEIGRLMDNRDMYVALYNRGTQMLDFPLAYEDGNQVQYPPRKAELVDPTQGGLTEVVLRDTEHRPFCPMDVAKWYAERGGPPVTAPIPKSWMGVPLMRGEQVLGVIALQNDEVAELYGSDDIEVLQAMSGAAAVALANTRLFEQLSVVNDAGQNLAAGIRLNEGKILDAIYEQASRLMDTRDMYIALYDAKTQELSFPLAVFDGERQYDWPSRKIDLTSELRGLTEVVLQTQKSLCPVDVEAWYKEQNIEPRVKPVPKSWVGVPLVRENQVLGIISLQNDEVANLYGVDDIVVLMTLAGQAAVALENARLYADLTDSNKKLADLNVDLEERVQERTKQLTALQDIGVKLASQLDQREVLEAIVQHAALITGADFFTLFPYDPDKGTFEAGIRRGKIEEIPTIPDSDGFTATIARNQQTLFVEDVEIRPEFKRNSIQGRATHAFASIPLINRGRSVGVLYVNYFEPHLFSQEEKKIIQLLTNQAAVAIENARLYNESIHRTEQFETLYNIGLTVNSKLDKSNVLLSIATGIHTLIHADVITIFPYNALRQEFDPGVRAGSTREEIRRPSGSGLAKQIAGRPNPVFKSMQAMEANEHEMIDGKSVASYAGIPLMFEEECVGVLFIDYFQDHFFSEDEKKLSLLFSMQAAIALHNARQYQQTQELAKMQRLVELGHLAGSLAHRIGNKGGLVRLGAYELSEYLEDKLKDDVIVKETLDDILRNNQYLLDLSHLLFKPLRATKERMVASNIVFLIKEAIKNANIPANIYLNTYYAESLPLVKVNRFFVEVFLEIIANAIEAMENSDSKILTIRTDYDDNWITVAFTDTGIGIPDSEKDRIFELLSHPSSENKKKHHLGFGLWWIRTFLRDIGGNIEVESQPGTGTTFTVRLPRG